MSTREDRLAEDLYGAFRGKEFMPYAWKALSNNQRDQWRAVAATAMELTCTAAQEANVQGGEAREILAALLKVVENMRVPQTVADAALQWFVFKGPVEAAQKFLAAPHPTPAPRFRDPLDPRYKQATGLYEKFRVSRADGSSEPGGKHEKCDYFVLDLTHDPHAYAAIWSYAQSCQDDYPALSIELRDIAHEIANRKESQ